MSLNHRWIRIFETFSAKKGCSPTRPERDWIRPLRRAQCAWYRGLQIWQLDVPLKYTKRKRFLQSRGVGSQHKRSVTLRKVNSTTFLKEVLYFLLRPECDVIALLRRVFALKILWNVPWLYAKIPLNFNPIIAKNENVSTWKVYDHIINQ